MTDSDSAALAAALIALSRYGILPDIQELLVRGNLDLQVPPGALAAALKAAGAEMQAEIEALKRDIERHEKTEPEIRGRPIPPGSIKTGPIPDFSEELRQMRETWQAVGDLDRQIRGQERNRSWLGRLKGFWKEISP